MSDWPPKGWFDGDPKERGEYLVIDSVWRQRHLMVFTPDRGWLGKGCRPGRHIVELWRPLPAIPPPRGE